MKHDISVHVTAPLAHLEHAEHLRLISRLVCKLTDMDDGSGYCSGVVSSQTGHDDLVFSVLIDTDESSCAEEIAADHVRCAILAAGLTVPVWGDRPRRALAFA